MFRTGFFHVAAVVVFIYALAAVDPALAGEKMKWHGASFTTDWQQMQIGEEPGHVLGVSKGKAIYFDEKTGERHLDTEVNTMDIDLKTGQGSLQGYGWTVDQDGDTMMRSHKGKMVEKNHWQGTWTLIKGTGKYEGVQGQGTWDSYHMGKGEPTYIEVEGEMRKPAQ